MFHLFETVQDSAGHAFTVSTISLGGGRFETLVFPGSSHLEVAGTRSFSEQEAREDHQRLLEEARAGRLSEREAE